MDHWRVSAAMPQTIVSALSAENVVETREDAVRSGLPPETTSPIRSSFPDFWNYPQDRYKFTR